MGAGVAPPHQPSAHSALNPCGSTRLAQLLGQFTSYAAATPGLQSHYRAPEAQVSPPLEKAADMRLNFDHTGAQLVGAQFLQVSHLAGSEKNFGLAKLELVFVLGGSRKKEMVLEKAAAQKRKKMASRINECDLMATRWRKFAKTLMSGVRMASQLARGFDLSMRWRRGASNLYRFRKSAYDHLSHIKVEREREREEGAGGP